MGSRFAPGLVDLAALTALEDPTRRRLYELVAGAEHAVSREEAAAGVGITRALAAYHLDKLSDHGLLEVETGRPPGKPGPGAGRPPKLYRRAGREFVVRTPPRDYHVLAELLVRVAAENDATRRALERTAGELGEALGRGRDSSVEVLRERGYEPIARSDGTVRLRNCPFAAVARECPKVVCAVNIALVRGILRAGGENPARARLVPHSGLCCVELAPV